MLRTDKKKQSKCILFVVRRMERVLIRAHERGAGKKKGKGEDGQKGRTRVDGRKQEKISKVKRGEELRSGIFCCGSNCVPLRPLWKAATEKQMFASAPFFLRLQITEIAAEIADRVCQGWQLQEPTDLGCFFFFVLYFFICWKTWNIYLATCFLTWNLQ